MAEKKSFLQSKTFWVNAVSAMAIVVQSQTGFIIDPATQAIGITVINAALRTITKQPIGI
ncbi:MAG: hypothetical protein WCK67_11365 [bacterium]